MEQLEFDILDELYFVLSFEKLMDEIDCESKDDLEVALRNMVDKGWVKVMSDVDTDMVEDELESCQYEHCYFLATKKGLFAHNTM
ncbi:transporter [Aureibacter tunicatorum]|uniref:Uncharacterized protein n=1 Tax=Aureibacter tunicatorum TaxID=866807 RepID=A0AAE3XNP2_9BACT|nr:transporter [Aureibacter tunicatorum]MDR6241266.1 hypothetical protein [Aureibacter tunicatorum]BDD03526.1 hypothetical protein AUTU_10090 [Aureibacter tunicatorum]